MKKSLNIITIIIASIFIFASCNKEEDLNSNYTDIASGILKTDLVADASISPYEAIFDVSPYYDQGHIPFSTNAGSVDGLENMLEDLDKSKKYLVYCHADGPSIAGAELMVENGFSNVYRLEGNFSAWDEISFQDILPSEVKSKIDGGEFEAIFDVSPYYNDGHLPGATNAKGSAGGTDLSELITSLDKSKIYLVYCHANQPAMAGAQLMEDEGFKNVYRLEGNYGAWVEAGYAVE